MKRIRKEEKSAAGKNRLNCGPFYGGRSGGPQTESISIELMPILGSIWVFSLPLAILLSNKRVTDKKLEVQPHATDASELHKKWKANPTSMPKPSEPAFSMKGFAIGWKINGAWWRSAPKKMNVRICTSPEVVAGVLAHIESGLLLVESSPIYTADRFLEGPFGFTEPVLKDESLFQDLKSTKIDRQALS